MYHHHALDKISVLVLGFHHPLVCLLSPATSVIQSLNNEAELVC